MGELWQPDVTLLIVGAGPAGLAAANAAAERGLKFLLVEAGPPVDHRQADVPMHLAQGVGGAGLYSDGKISFYPSATKLWALNRRPELTAAYSWFAQLIREVDESLQAIPGFPDANKIVAPDPTNPSLAEKQYSSVKLSWETRLKLIDRLASRLGSSVLTGAYVHSIERSDGPEFDVLVRQRDTMTRFSASNIVFCGGRFGPLVLHHLMPELDHDYRRFEFGVRIEQPACSFCLANHNQVDPKIILSVDNTDISYRTFCCCREGKIVLTQFGDIKSYSGTSFEHTSWSSTGFNCRISSIDGYNKVKLDAEKLLAGAVSPFSVPLRAFLDRQTAPCFGSSLDELIRVGLARFVDYAKLEEGALLDHALKALVFTPDCRARLNHLSLLYMLRVIQPASFAA